MPKRPNIAATGIFQNPPQPKIAAFDPAPTAEAVRLPTKPKTTGSRTGKRATPFWTPTAAKKQLDLLAVDMDTTIQALLTEAVNDLFKKYDRPPIA